MLFSHSFLVTLSVVASFNWKLLWGNTFIPTNPQQVSHWFGTGSPLQPGWPEASCVDQAGLSREVILYLSLPPKCWDYRQGCVATTRVFALFLFWGKDSYNVAQIGRELIIFQVLGF